MSVVDSTQRCELPVIASRSRRFRPAMRTSCNFWRTRCELPVARLAVPSGGGWTQASDLVLFGSVNSAIRREASKRAAGGRFGGRKVQEVRIVSRKQPRTESITGSPHRRAKTTRNGIDRRRSASTTAGRAGPCATTRPAERRGAAKNCGKAPRYADSL